MKKIAALTLAIGFLLTACMPAPATNLPAPTVDLNATAEVFVQQTLQALPTMTTAPTNTPVVVTETATLAPTETATATSDITATATVSTIATTQPAGTVTSTASASTGTVSATLGSATIITTTTATATLTPIPNGIPSATETLHPRFYGTLPPNVPYSGIELVNKSKAEAYISLQVTLRDGSISILEYPVGGLFAIRAPAGKYKYVAWVGGNKIIGSFVLDNSKDIRITIYKDRVEIKTR